MRKLGVASDYAIRGVEINYAYLLELIKGTHDQLVI